MAVQIEQKPVEAGAMLAVEAIVEARGVVKTYDTGKVEVHALRGVDLRLARGEMVAIMGPSGCGKTTLLTVSPGSTRSTPGRW